MDVPPPYDLLIVGGGVNGCGLARDAAGRGLNVLLCEKADLASGTSSASTKLIHGGLRYLEHYAFNLVRHALAERERLLAIAPHIIWPMRFVLPYQPGLRPAWMLRLGLFVYDHIGGRKLLAPTRTLRLDRDEAGEPLREGLRLAFEYSDCWVQDARLVSLNARDAAERGADIRVGAAFTSAERLVDRWRVTLTGDDGAREVVEARVLVNAAGPWVSDILDSTPGVKPRGRVRLVQGSHIVTRKLYAHDRCYFFQNPDGRIFFAIPYEQDFTLIGTTDQDYMGDARAAAATEVEIDYLRAAAARYFRRPIGREDIVWTYSGVRPLFDDGASAAKDATRDYVLDFDHPAGRAAVLTIFGGKITTYRRLAEEALEMIGAALPSAARNAGWTGRAPLPGGDFPVDGAGALAADFRREYPFLDARAAWRLVRHYGTESRRFLGAARRREDLGELFGGDLHEAEVEHLMRHEYVRSAADVVWRRTKSGLRMSADEIAALNEWMKRRRA